MSLYPTKEQRDDWRQPHREAARTAWKKFEEEKAREIIEQRARLAELITEACKKGGWSVGIPGDLVQSKHWPMFKRELEDEGYKVNHQVWTERGEYNVTQFESTSVSW